MLTIEEVIRYTDILNYSPKFLQNHNLQDLKHINFLLHERTLIVPKEHLLQAKDGLRWISALSREGKQGFSIPSENGLDALDELIEEFGWTSCEEAS